MLACSTHDYNHEIVAGFQLRCSCSSPSEEQHRQQEEGAEAAKVLQVQILGHIMQIQLHRRLDGVACTLQNKKMYDIFMRSRERTACTDVPGILHDTRVASILSSCQVCGASHATRQDYIDDVSALP